MKAAKGVDDLAARLMNAAATPLVAPAAPASVATSSKRERKVVAKKEVVKREPVDTMQLTLRPERALYARYVAAAADRSRVEGRVVSAQEVMLEILEKGAI